MNQPEDDRTEPVLLEEPIESPSPSPPPPAPRLAAATLPPPIPAAARRSSTPPVGLLTVTSFPPGATVVIVSAGRAHIAGLTPLRTTVDPRLHHDIIVAANGYDTFMRRLTPHAPREVEVYLSSHRV
ncbi:MAG: PEGA domain-containing protein [Deltaproteobacteria bacterium]|nr:PEGA domain-containing protein [Deltaproteobacteria bacterium]